MSIPLRYAMLCTNCSYISHPQHDACPNCAATGGLMSLSKILNRDLSRAEAATVSHSHQTPLTGKASALPLTPSEITDTLISIIDAIVPESERDHLWSASRCG